MYEVIDTYFEVSDNAMEHWSETSHVPYYETSFLTETAVRDIMDGTLHIQHNLDETDLEIIGRVEDDFDVSLETLADNLELSKSAVHYRLNKLKDSGVIQGVTADIDPLSVGLEMVAITDVSVIHESGYSENIGEELNELYGVEQVYYTMGDVDFVVVSRVQTRDQLNDLIDQIVAVDGVNETSSKFVMQEFESNRSTVANLSDEARQAVLDAPKQ